MASHEEVQNWQQYFPTYKLSNPEVALREFESSLRSYEAEERVFLHAAQITLLVGAGLGSLLLGGIDKVITSTKSALPPGWTVGLLSILAAVFSFTTLRYFADRQKAIVFAARKVIVLRRMLGLSYGTQQLVLPNWRIEGADEPFVVRMFPGWNTYVAYPFWILGGFSLVVGSFLAALGLSLTSSAFLKVTDRAIVAVLVGLLWSVFLAGSYRKALSDLHGSGLQLWAKRLARVMGVRLVDNFEHVIYRARLAVFEAQRLGLDLSSSYPILIQVEDKGFYRHHGVSVRATLAAVLSTVSRRKRRGGSTVSQQLVRTLFIIDYHKTVRRKILETLLAVYLETKIEKREVLAWYLVSVRFERRVLGVIAGMKYFFGRIIKRPTKAQWFFLCERLANTRSLVLEARVDELCRKAVADGQLMQDDLAELAQIYELQVRDGRIQSSNPDRFVKLLGSLRAKVNN